MSPKDDKSEVGDGIDEVKNDSRTNNAANQEDDKTKMREHSKW